MSSSSTDPLPISLQVKYAVRFRGHVKNGFLVLGTQRFALRKKLNLSQSVFEGTIVLSSPSTGNIDDRRIEGEVTEPGIKVRGKATLDFSDGEQAIYNIDTKASGVSFTQVLVAQDAPKASAAPKNSSGTSLSSAGSPEISVASAPPVFARPPEIKSPTTIFIKDELPVGGNVKKNSIKFGTNPLQDPGGKVLVFYGTNRKPTGNTDPNEFYGSNRGELQQGTCMISIPPGHRQGVLERPGKFLFFWENKENPGKHIILQSLTPLIDSEYYNQLRTSIYQTESKAAFVFVHGFNVSFNEAAWRCGQIAYDLPFSGVATFFSWPSGGQVRYYGTDIERADASVTALVTFIKNLVENAGVRTLHFIGHSMGNRILTRSLNQLVQLPIIQNNIEVISQVVLAAADIDQDVFDTEIYPVFKTIGKRRTLYASNQDIALLLSEKLRTGLKRVGEGGADVYVADGIDTVDASNISTAGLQHSYIFEDPQLLYDVNMLLTSNANPKDRRLREAMKDKLKYWLFRE